MANFQYFVHRVSGLVEDINTTLNSSEGGFYHLDRAIMFGEMIKDKYNFTIIYDASGKLHTLLPR